MFARAARVLSFHAGYRCRDSGVCCSAGWPIPIEADRVAALRSALVARRVRPISGHPDRAIVSGGDDADGPCLLGTTGGRCVFHEPAGACAIHRALGHDSLPMACRQFPRSSVIDPRGVSITLSHYCPTAAGLLRSASEGANSVDVVVDAPGFPADGEYEGLDARLALPPLLRPGMLMDWEAWWELERLAVADLLHGPGDAEAALTRLSGRVEVLRSWTPADGALIDRIQRVFGEEHGHAAHDDSALMADAITAIPESFREPARWQEPVMTTEMETRRFLAAHAFANWPIHLGGDVTTWVRAIQTARAFLVAGAGVAQTDLILRHLADLNVWTQKLGSGLISGGN